MKYFIILICALLLNSNLLAQDKDKIIAKDKAIFRLQNKVYFFSNIQETLRVVQRYHCLVPKNKISPLFFKLYRKPSKELGHLKDKDLNQQQIKLVESVISLLKLEVYTWRQTQGDLNINHKKKRCPHKNIPLERLKTFAAVDEFLSKRFNGKKIIRKELESLMVLVNRKIKHYAFY